MSQTSGETWDITSLHYFQKLMFLGHLNYRALHACVEKKDGHSCLRSSFRGKERLCSTFDFFLRIIFPFAHPVVLSGKKVGERATNAKVARATLSIYATLTEVWFHSVISENWKS